MIPSIESIRKAIASLNNARVIHKEYYFRCDDGLYIVEKTGKKLILNKLLDKPKRKV